MVAKNVSGWGFFDLVAVRPSAGSREPETILVDVKSYNQKHYTYSPLTKKQSWSRVRILLVADDGHCEFVEPGKERVRERDQKDVE